MRKALVTFAVGPHVELLEIAKPSYKAWAHRHGYDFLVAEGIHPTRPPAWYKIPLLQTALCTYDEAVFIGADLVIVDGREDFSMEVPADAWQAMVNHHTGDGEVPNDDMWFCRKPMQPILEQVWEMTQWMHHGWWEQAALLELMGYKVPQPTTLVEPTELYKHTYFLDSSWNVHCWDKPQPEHPRFQHATMYPDRAEVMREWAREAEKWMTT